ncbi:alpha/beta hydrolase [Frigidibacter oleivorans]|uniref:alpha/beta hydrolase n=1 Tax=Frigidibacter oleivorans TaxID=2487129 RepID=UPI000F8E5AD1|nr:alpha/beta hydrolase [Frigidibacter oleivorans]
MTTIFFASNRNIRHRSSSKGDLFGDRFNADGPQIFRVGEAEVTLTGPDPKEDDSWQVGASTLYDEQLRETAKTPAKLGSAALFEKLRRILKEEERDVLIYIHGFANSFENSLRRAAALQELYSTARQKVQVVLFSWPSNGTVQPAWHYFSDRDDAAASGIAMARALQRLVEFLTEMRLDDRQTILDARKLGAVPDPDDLRQCTRRLHLVAHSMGNWALRHALQRFVAENGGRLPRIFDCVFLMAADEDHDALADAMKLGPLDALANRVMVYHAADDVALAVSDTTKGMADRLGTDGPQNLDRLSARILAIDCGLISKTALSHGRHQYYRLRDEVIGDVQMSLAAVPQDGRPGRSPIQPGRSWRLLAG